MRQHLPLLRYYLILAYRCPQGREVYILARRRKVIDQFFIALPMHSFYLNIAHHQFVIAILRIGLRGKGQVCPLLH
jgi:hypothetical protein